MSEYAGPERRRNGSKDHDLLTRIDANLTNFMVNFQRHVEEDAKQFKSQSDKLEFHQKIVYGGMGIVAAFEVWARFAK